MTTSALVSGAGSPLGQVRTARLGAGSGIGVGVVQFRIDPAFPMPFLHAHHLAHYGGLMLFFGRYIGTAVRLTAGAVRRR